MASREDAARAEAAAFVAGFVTPLVTGGELRVGAAVDAKRAEDWIAAAESGALAGDVEDLDRARAAFAAQIVVRPPELALGGEEMRMALALYDALALAHPDLERWTARGGKRKYVLEVALALATLPPADRRTLLARHTLLARLHAAHRQDTRVRWWTGSAEFKGQSPPPRLSLWPGLRRVRVDSEVVPLVDLLGFEEGQRLLVALYEASPLTDILSPDRTAPGFSWHGGGLLAILRDAELARFVAHSWIQAERAQTVLPAVAAAWERMLGQAVEIDHVRAVTAFLSHVGLLAAMVDAPARGDDAATRLFWAIPEVAARVAPELSQPPGLDAASVMARRWHALRVRGLQQLGPAADKSVALLGSRLRP